METYSAADSVQLYSPTDSQRMTLPIGHRFVMLIDGRKPWLMPITEPGTYQIEPPALLRGAITFPVSVITAPEEVAKALTTSTKAHRITPAVVPPTHKDILQ